MLGGICWMAGDYCPKNYAEANGQELQRTSYPALYSLMGNVYGGTGNSFQLPDLRGRSVVAENDSPGRQINRGDKRGSTTTTLTPNDMPAHLHMINPAMFNLSGTLKANISTSTANSPANGYPGVASANQTQAYYNTTPEINMKEGIVTASISGLTGTTEDTGAALPINITAPRLGLTACIAIKGYYPQRP
ncbi:hypothetical protein LF95_14785 [Thalassospira sp. TSL5-1]|nr:hypothetical protein LF95_14785 [Thalassospira sp. TSL5-1]